MGHHEHNAGTAASADHFGEHRGLLFGVAYRMLGSVADAEDVLQDTWLTWNAADRAGVAHPKAYLVRTVTNLSINRLTSARAVRERYIGPWLPEPLLTAPDSTEKEAEMADSVSMALLVVLETLTPVERAVFVLHEVFGYPYGEIAGYLERPEATIRQIAHRARGHVRARRPRCDTEEQPRTAIVERFLAACRGGDVNALMEVLAPDVTAWNDGGGKITAARRPVHGPDHVARWMIGVLAKPISAGIELATVPVNGETGILGTIDGHPIGVLTFEIAGGCIHGLRFQVNPDKLGGVCGGPNPVE
ncbi:RNA polymerase sigma-70 factor [Nocardia grenadensis]